MSAKEFDLFLAFVKKSENYVEFGTGGSTYVASQHVGKSIISLDSSQEWLDKVSASCADSRIKPQMVYVDIGPLAEWGHPRDPGALAALP